MYLQLKVDNKDYIIEPQASGKFIFGIYENGNLIGKEETFTQESIRNVIKEIEKNENDTFEVVMEEEVNFEKNNE